MELLYDTKIAMNIYGYDVVGYINPKTSKIVNKRPKNRYKYEYIPIYHKNLELIKNKQ